MGKKVDAFLAELAKQGDGRWSYYNDATGKGIGCSNYVEMCLKNAGIINANESLWAAKCIVGPLGDTSRFEKLPWGSQLKAGDILWSHGHHVAVWAGDEFKSLYEAAPESTHSLAVCGTGVGLHRAHTEYNCGTGTRTWTCIYRIIDLDNVAPVEEEKKKEAPVKIIKKEEPAKINMVQLKKGSKNSYVSILQMLLNKQGCGLAIDGCFGNLTYSAVKKYQMVNGLIVDGIVGPQTWESLLKKLPVVQRNSSGLYVSALQLFLNARTGSRLAVDGSFGPATQMAVKSFQKAKGLAQDGICGPKTWGALFA